MPKIEFDQLDLFGLTLDRGGKSFTAQRMPLVDAALEGIRADWADSYGGRLDHARVEYSIDRILEDGEVFSVESVPMPKWLSTLTGLRNLHDASGLEKSELRSSLVKGLAAIVRTGSVHQLLFQVVTPSRIVKPKRILWIIDGHFALIDSPSLQIGPEISFTYGIDDQRLTFRALKDVARFFPVDTLVGPADADQIRDVLSHPKLSPENIDVTVAQADSIMKRKFAAIQASGILDAVTVENFEDSAVRCNVTLDIQNGRIRVPSQKAACKILLKFLNEEYMRGLITGTLYEVNSKQLAT